MCTASTAIPHHRLRPTQHVRALRLYAADYACTLRRSRNKASSSRPRHEDQVQAKCSRIGRCHRLDPFLLSVRSPFGRTQRPLRLRRRAIQTPTYAQRAARVIHSSPTRHHKLVLWSCPLSARPLRGEPSSSFLSFCEAVLFAESLRLNDGNESNKLLVGAVPPAEGLLLPRAQASVVRRGKMLISRWPRPPTDTT